MPDCLGILFWRHATGCNYAYLILSSTTVYISVGMEDTVFTRWKH